MAKIVGDEAVFYSAAFDMDPPALGKGRSGYCRKLTAAEQQLIRAAELRVAAALSSPSAQELRDALAFIERQGYRRCDIAACNCGSWHGGHASQRLCEIEAALVDSGIEMNGKTILAGVQEALALSSPSVAESPTKKEA